jgi:hypothetical protein
MFADPRHQPINLKPAYQGEYDYQAALIATPCRPEQLAEVSRELERLHSAAEAPPRSPLYVLVLDDDVDEVMPPSAARVARGRGYEVYTIPPHA